MTSTGHQPSSQNDLLTIASETVRGKNLLFVTGRLAEPSLREVVAPLADGVGFQFEIAVPGVQVAALLHADLLKRRLQISSDVDRVILPGWCQGDVDSLTTHFQVPFIRGPKDLYDLPEFFGVGKRRAVTLDQWSIEIIAEINHATQRTSQDVVREAVRLARDGANRIDVGCVPGESSPHVGELVRALRNEGLAVSIDSFDRDEVEQAVAAGADLILSCNQSNLEWVTKTGAEVVAIPETPDDLNSLLELARELSDRECRFRADPILEPVGMGFARSLERYFTFRRQFPDVPMMMGTGNLTELSEVDSAGVNFVLAAICEELRIASVLTTQVVHWCRTSVAELNAARRLVHYAVSNQVLPKHVDSGLVMLRDARRRPQSSESLAVLAAAIKDPGFRIFANPDSLHLMNNLGHWSGEDPFAMFAAALETTEHEASGKPVTASHAFYLGYEMARAQICRFLDKQYTQDGPIRWGAAGSE
ncbi:MAG: dihydropteroate synthase [Planctomycetaceae bacterium]|nr:dihydropteroate synthase [Planctomycetaceae bacterium]